MKKSLIAIGIVLTMALAGCGIPSTSSTGSGSKMESKLSKESWSFTQARYNGHHTARNVDLTRENLSAMQVKCSLGEGSAKLTVIQGNSEKIFDLGGEYIGYIDVGGFEPGRFQLRVDLDHARDIDVLISW